MLENQSCRKIELASTCGFRVMYCQECQIVELEIGALTLRFSPEFVQRFANIMMKASLRLELLTQQQSAASMKGQALH